LNQNLKTQTKTIKIIENSKTSKIIEKKSEVLWGLMRNLLRHLLLHMFMYK